MPNFSVNGGRKQATGKKYTKKCAAESKIFVLLIKPITFFDVFLAVAFAKVPYLSAEDIIRNKVQNDRKYIDHKDQV